MTNERRGGVGFGGGRGHEPADFDEEVESTRAMDLVDDLDQPTTMPSRAPAPPPRAAPPPPPRPQPSARPAPAAAPRPAPRPAPSAPPAGHGGPPRTLHDPAAFGSQEEDATRMLDSDDFAPPPAAAPSAGESGIPIELRVVSGPDRGKVHRLHEGEQLVGRGLDCQIVLADPAVSRKHFRLLRRGDTVEIIDMGGANGSNVNGERVARQKLRSGDQIEIGTSVMEFHVVGAAVERARDFPKSEAGAQSQDRKPVLKPKGNTGLWIAVAVAGLLVLAGGAVAAWQVMSNSDEAASSTGAEADAPEAKSVTELIAQAQALIEERDWAGATDKLRAARKQSPDDAEIKGLLAKAGDELEAEEAIAEGKDLLKKGDLAAAMARFKDVPSSSEQYSEAREELKGSQDAFIRGQLEKARAAVEAGKKSEAAAALTAILEIDEKHQEAKLLQQQIETMVEGAAPPEVPGAAKPDKPAVPGAAAVDAKPGKEGAEPAEGGSGNAKTLLATAYTAYHNRQWSAADTALSQVVDGGFSRKDKAKATSDREAMREVAEGFQAAEANAGSPGKAAKAWVKAYEADKRIDGHHAPFLVKKVSSSFVAAADQAFKAKRYDAAHEAVQEAMNYDPDSTAAMELDDKIKAAARQMLKDAERHLKEKNYITARDQAKKAALILGSSDPDAAKAKEIVLKANDASAGGEED